MEKEKSNAGVSESEPSAELRPQLTKEEKTERDKIKLQENIDSSNFNRLNDKVAFILSYFPQSRNSDIELAFNFWNYFEHEIMKEGEVDKMKMFSLTKITSLSRARAKIQNEYKLFVADPEVKKHRRRLREVFESDNINDKPLDHSYFVYVDESGKNEQYLIVGSIWLFSFGPAIHNKRSELNEWKKRNGVDYEFHFKNLKSNHLRNYKLFAEKFIGLNPEVSFKAIVLANNGLGSKEQAIVDLTNHLLYNGVVEENRSGRAMLPRNLHVTIDKDQEGQDVLNLANIKERLRAQNLEGLKLQNFTPEDSYKNEYIQMTDLLTASLNRIINFPGKATPKDEFAKYLLGLLNVDLEEFNVDKFNTSLENADSSKIFNLK